MNNEIKKIIARLEERKAFFEKAILQPYITPEVSEKYIEEIGKLEKTIQQFRALLTE